MAALAVMTAAFLSIPVAQALPPVDGNGFFHLNSGESEYYGYAPDSYDAATPISLFVWMHGCGGEAYGDMFAIAPFATRANQSYIAISIGGRDGGCWKPNEDAPKVLAAITDVARYFKINQRKIYLGGYSSGGDLTYRVGFEHTNLFAGLLVENSDPFRDTGATQASLLASASWKINVAHLAHTEDDTYPIAGVRTNLQTLVNNGFPVHKIERPGTHYDPDNANSGTNYDLIHFLLPYLDAGWTSPALPAVTLKTPNRVVTKNRAYKIKGSVPAGAAVARVEVKVGHGKYAKTARTKNWIYQVRLKFGRNKVLVRAVAPNGKFSAVERIIIIRK